MYRNQVVITDELLKKYYNEHKNTFIEPVKVKVKYIEFDPSTVTVPDNITDAELQSYYLKIRTNLNRMSK